MMHCTFPHCCVKWLYISPTLPFPGRLLFSAARSEDTAPLNCFLAWSPLHNVGFILVLHLLVGVCGGVQYQSTP